MEIPRTDEILDYLGFDKKIIDKSFIITHEHEYKSLSQTILPLNIRREPCGRPVVCRVVDNDPKNKIFTVETYDYDQKCKHTTNYPYPSTLDVPDRANLCFTLRFKHNGRDLLVRFWSI